MKKLIIPIICLFVFLSCTKHTQLGQTHHLIVHEINNSSFGCMYTVWSERKKSGFISSKGSYDLIFTFYAPTNKFMVGDTVFFSNEGKW